MILKKRLVEEINKIKKKINKDEKPITIQIPEGLKQYSLLILDLFKEYDPYLFVDPCYGACDTKDYESKILDSKLLIHFGHYKMYSTKIKTYFIPIDYILDKKDIDFIVENILKLNLKKINLVTTIQYLSNIENIKNKLSKKGVVVNKCKQTNRIKEHMLLGCDSSTITNKKDPTIFIGDGLFHVNNVAFKQKNKVFAISPLNKTIKEIKINSKFLKQRYALISKAKDAKKIGILVSSKKGQNRINIANQIKRKIEEKLNKKAYIFVSDYINPEYLLGIKVDAFINTACPRITYDDFLLFKKPVLSVSEVDLLIDINKDLKIDNIN
jgi:2-(3-amino-3-carboxypropyl)histidine synthase